MWIFTNKGFISIVQHRNDADLFMVRARVREHLAEMFPGRKITSLEVADYRFRVVIDREAMQKIVTAQLDAVDYDNFKNSIRDTDYHDACCGVWEVMHRLQESAE